MSEFRGSRRLMARILQVRKVQQASRDARQKPFSADEIATRRRLDTEARLPWQPTGIQLVKQAPKREA
jgi:hypothetical protein